MTSPTTATAAPASSPSLVQAEIDRLERAIRERHCDNRAMPNCIDHAYRAVIEKRRAQLRAMQR